MSDLSLFLHAKAESLTSIAWSLSNPDQEMIEQDLQQACYDLLEVVFDLQGKALHEEHGSRATAMRRLRQVSNDPARGVTATLETRPDPQLADALAELQSLHGTVQRIEHRLSESLQLEGRFLK